MKSSVVIAFALVALSTQRVLQPNITLSLLEPSRISFNRFFKLPGLSNVLKKKKLAAPQTSFTASGIVKTKTKTTNITKIYTTTVRVKSVRTKYITQNIHGKKVTEYATLTETSHVPIYTTKIETRTDNIPVIRYKTSAYTFTNYITAVVYGATSTATLFLTTAIPKIVLHPQPGQTETWTTTEREYATRVVTSIKHVSYPVTVTTWQSVTERMDPSTVIQRVTEYQNGTNYATTTTVTKIERVEVPVQYYNNITTTFTESQVPQYIRVPVTEMVPVVTTESVPYYVDYTVTQQVPIYQNITLTHEVPVYSTAMEYYVVTSTITATVTAQGQGSVYLGRTSLITVTTTETTSVPLMTVARNYPRTSTLVTADEPTTTSESSEKDEVIAITSTAEDLISSPAAEQISSSNEELTATLASTIEDNKDAITPPSEAKQECPDDYSTNEQPQERAHIEPMGDLPTGHPIRPSPWHQEREDDLMFPCEPQESSEQSIKYAERYAEQQQHDTFNDSSDSALTASSMVMVEMPLDDVEEVVVRTTLTSTVTNTVLSTIERPAAAAAQTNSVE
jgi:hypothetical protein